MTHVRTFIFSEPVLSHSPRARKHCVNRALNDYSTIRPCLGLLLLSVGRRIHWPSHGRESETNPARFPFTVRQVLFASEKKLTDEAPRFRLGHHTLAQILIQFRL